MTTNEALAGGLIVGSLLAVYIVFAIIFSILVIIAGWKMFSKAGIAGWKVLIPIYNCYLFYKIANVNFWIWLVIPAALVSIVNVLSSSNDNNVWISILAIIALVYMIVGYCKFCKGLATSYGKGTGFAVGLFFLPNVFQLILGFGSAKYVRK